MRKIKRPTPRYSLNRETVRRLDDLSAVSGGKAGTGTADCLESVYCTITRTAVVNCCWV